MASRPHVTIDTRALAEAPDRLRRWIEHSQRLGWKLVLWRTLWFPYWFGGELPAPWLPDERDTGSLPDAPAARATVEAIDAIGRRAWLNMGFAALVRGLWLPFLFGSVAIFWQYLRGDVFSPERFVWVWAITVPLALLFAFALRPNRERTAAMLDRTFELHDRLKTALEGQSLPAHSRTSRSEVPYLQLADSANVADGLLSDPRFRIRLPSRELSLAILFGLLMLSLLFLRGVGGDLPALADSSVPRFVPAAERQTTAAGELSSDAAVRPPTVEEVQAASDRSASAMQDLNTLADALESNAITQAAADAIRAGDYAAAGQALRESASQAASLPAESRETLAAALEQAASATSESSPALSNAAAEAAEGLQEGGEAATSSMQDLGDAVELAGDSVVSNDVLAEQMQQAQQAAAGAQEQGADAAAQGQSSNPSGSANPNAGQGGDPGSPMEGGSDAGADANAGASESQPSDSPSGGEQGDMIDASSGAPGQQPGANGEAEQPGGEGAPGDTPGGDGTESSESGNQIGQEPGSASGESDVYPEDLTAQQSGTGASSGGADQIEPDQEGETGAGQNTGETSTGEPPVEPDVSNAAPDGGAGSEPTVTASQSIGLSDSGGGDAFQLGGGGSASSLGSGAGVMVAGGSGTQEPVSEAGPESNRTPEEYRPIVEDYFARD